MKNIHILPTDKPGWVGRFIDTNNLFLRISNDIPRGENVNIYITNSEEIKEGDWCLEFNALGNKIMDVCKAPCIIPGECILIKIILTTDPTLIADGVQAIDDEFLEWFVNNSSCEEVKIVEEPKQETLEDIKLEEVFGSEYCQFPVIENKLAILYRNQEQILKAIKLLSNETRNT